jgi:hypothetical protein
MRNSKRMPTADFDTGAQLALIDPQGSHTFQTDYRHAICRCTFAIAQKETPEQVRRFRLAS